MSIAAESRSRLNTIVRACRLIGRMTKGRPGVPLSHQIYYRMLGDYFANLMRAQEEKRLVVGHTIFFPVEILYAMDMVPMHTELTAWMTALFTGNCSSLLAKSAEVGLAQEICSPYRVLAGALALGSLPRPDAVVWSNLICDNAGKGGEFVTQTAGCPGFFMDCPFQNSPAEDKYLKQEILDMIAFLETLSGRKLDWNRLSEGIVQMQRQLELIREINELRKNIPAPLPPQDFLKLFTVDCLFAGQPEATGYLEAVRDELKEKITEPNVSPAPERFRIMNLLMPPVLLLDSIERVSRECGAVSVVDPLFCQWGEGHLDPQKPLESILQKIAMNPVMVMYGPLDDRITKLISKCADEYRIDGAIKYAHVGCRQSAALIKLMKDTLNDKDIPVLVLDCDIVDITVSPEAEVSAKLKQFYELLEEKI